MSRNQQVAGSNPIAGSRKFKGLSELLLGLFPLDLVKPTRFGVHFAPNRRKSNSSMNIKTTQSRAVF